MVGTLVMMEARTLARHAGGLMYIAEHIWYLECVRALGSTEQNISYLVLTQETSLSPPVYQIPSIPSVLSCQHLPASHPFTCFEICVESWSTKSSNAPGIPSLQITPGVPSRQHLPASHHFMSFCNMYRVFKHPRHTEPAS